jgi:nucleoside-diphosphate-sugar epimerase
MSSINKYNILVAGHTGFIGKSLVKKLSVIDSVNLILVSRSNGFNLLDAEVLEDIDCDIVINLAGLISIDDSWCNPSEYYKNNYLITLNLLEYARKKKASFIQIGSYVYGIPKYQPIDELHPVEGYNPYSSSKLISDLICESYSKHHGLNVTILRPFNVYGTEMSDRFLISKLINSAINGDELTVLDLSAKRDYLWIDDLINGIEKVIFSIKKGFYVYNMGRSESNSAMDIIEIISSKINNVSYSVTGHSESILIKDCICNNNAFSEDYNWKAKVDLSNGIRMMFNSKV